MREPDSKLISNLPYISDRFFEDEKKVWRNSWLMMGRELDIKDAGQFISFDIKAINVSLAIVRDSQGTLNAFYNICPHRSGRLFCDRVGKKAAIVCRFHGWTFGLDGELRGIPEEQLFPGINKSEISLRSISIDTWAGFIFVNLNPHPKNSLKDYLHGVAPGLEAYLANPKWQWHTGYQKIFKANWKDLMNIQHEGYHATHVHKRTLGATFTPDEIQSEYFEDSPGACSLLTVHRPRISGDAPTEMTLIQQLSMKYGTTSNWVDQDTSRAAKEIEKGVNFSASDKWVFDCYTFFPNLILFVGTDVLSVMRVWPIDAHNADWEWDWYFKDEMKNFGNLFNREHGRMATRNALAEDWPVVEWAHENMRTGVFENSYIAVDMEATVRAHYEKLLKHMHISEDDLKNDYA